MPENWSPEEVAATVADYFVMLEHELRGEPYNKREHNRRLQELLHDRSAAAIELKHANISAVLIGLGFPYIDGYKPRANYQGLLRDEVAVRLDHDAPLTRAAELAVVAPVAEPSIVGGIAAILVDAPRRDREQRRGYERHNLSPVPTLGVNYLEREAQNSSLGLAGEEFALEFEHMRLYEAGKKLLAERVEHVAKSKGDGLGYDILSFDTDGRERLIEVKTTAFGAMTPFFASRREVTVSEELAPQFKLYRIFKFRDAPKMFVLPGSLRESCDLDPVQYRASLA